MGERIRKTASAAGRGVFLMVLAALGPPAFAGGRDIEPVKNFDVNRYLGRWYEIARLPHRFEKDLVNVTATYAFRPDGKISVLNEGYKLTPDGKKSAARGKAKFAGDRSVGHLKVSFFGPFYADYVVADLDTAGYAWALVTGRRPGKYLWILAREPRLDPAVTARLVEKAKSLGIDTEKLIRVGQDWATARDNAL